MWAADAVEKERWNHTAQLTATLLEINRDRKKRTAPITAAECHPYHRRRGSSRGGVPYTRELVRARAKQWFAEQARKKGHARTDRRQPKHPRQGMVLRPGSGAGASGEGEA